MTDTAAKGRRAEASAAREARWLRGAASSALLGALAATAGDLGQLWVVNAGRPELLLSGPPSWGIVIASLAGALGVPLYALGYGARAWRARATAPRRAAALGILGAAFAAIGGSVHATTGVLIWARVGEIASGLDPLQGVLASGPIVLGLWALGVAAFVLASLVELSLPQSAWRRLTSPAPGTVLFSALAATLPLPWRDFLGPAAINLAHVLFFASLAVQRRR